MRPTGGTSKGALYHGPSAAAAASAVARALSVRTCVVQTGPGTPSGWGANPGDVTAAHPGHEVLGGGLVRHLARAVELPAEDARVEVGSGIEIGDQGLHPAGDAVGVCIALAHFSSFELLVGAP